MPRVSSAPEDAFHFKGSFEEGWGEIVDAKSVVFQYPPQKEASGNRLAGFQSPPGLFVCLSIQRYLDKTTKAGVPAEEVMLSLAAAGKEVLYEAAGSTLLDSSVELGAVQGMAVDAPM